MHIKFSFKFHNLCIILSTLSITIFIINSDVGVYMKRVIIALLIFASIIFTIEHTTIAGISNYQPAVTVSRSNNEYVLNWSKPSFPCYYKIEILTQPPQETSAQPSQIEKIVSYYTLKNDYPVNLNFPHNTYWRISAQGLFAHPLGLPSDDVYLAQVSGTNTEQISTSKPTLLSNYSVKNPASCQTLLEWTKVPGAVYYELEISAVLPPRNDTPADNPVLSTHEVFTNGYNSDLTYLANQMLYWRVRAYDYNDVPIGLYSDPQTLYIDSSNTQNPRPIINCSFNDNDMITPLYPVYSWIPIAGIATYEVEVTNAPPENPNGTLPSVYRIWNKTITGGSDIYDEQARCTNGTYYWRVRGIDGDGSPVGVWSDAEPFTVDTTKGKYAATFGDSITHGGGCISYSPADVEYSFQTYLNFPVINLGKSGDTSESLAKRFERDVLPFHPRYLIIMGGTNSLREGIPADEVIKDLSAIRNRCIAHGIRPIFLTLPPINPANIAHAFSEETVENWREEFATVNNFIRQQRYYIDIAPYFTNADGQLPTYYAVDGLHYDIEGKKLMALIINANWSKVSR